MPTIQVRLRQLATSSMIIGDGAGEHEHLHGRLRFLLITDDGVEHELMIDVHRPLGGLDGATEGGVPKYLDGTPYKGPWSLNGFLDHLDATGALAPRGRGAVFLLADAEALTESYTGPTFGPAWEEDHCGIVFGDDPRYIATIKVEPGGG